ncbi:MAG: inositol monophosphatase family protein [Methanobacteriota archaeon]
MRSLLFEIADAVQKAVQSTDGAFEDVDVAMGADGTPTTRIDKIAEDAVLKVLAKHGNPLNVLSEECDFQDNGREMTLVLDPIDGTVNATSGFPFYAVSLAVGSRDLDGVAFALVRNLATGETFYAGKGMGAFRNGERIKVRGYDPEKGIFLVYLGNHADKSACRIAGVPRRTRSFGSAALETCMVASGSADMYAIIADQRIRGLRVVDIAAASLILREAGGELYEPNGKKFTMAYDIKDRKNVVAVGDRKALEAAGMGAAI